MAQDANDLSGAEEYVAAEIDLTEPLGLEEEKNLRDALQQLDARVFASCNIGPKKISLSDADEEGRSPPYHPGCRWQTRARRERKLTFIVATSDSCVLALTQRPVHHRPSLITFSHGR